MDEKKIITGDMIEKRQLSLHTQFGHQVIFKSMGFTGEELSLPRIAVVNSWSEQSPGHSHLRTISEGVKAGIRMAGGMPFEINTIGPCSVLNGGAEDLLYDMPQREAILASIESALHVGFCHGWVGIGSCDKIVPGMLLAALRLNRPFIFLGGGQMLPCEFEGERFGYVKGFENIARQHTRMRAGSLSRKEYACEMETVTSCCGTSAGACGEMTTGNPMQLLTEALGFSIPRSSTSVAVSAEKIWQAKETGKRIVDLSIRKIRPSEIFTLNSLKNVMAVDMAICGGTNSIIHFQSCAHEAGLNCSIDLWDEASNRVPALLAVAPSGPHVIYDFHREGGVPVIMKIIENILDTSCLTVTGKSLADNLANVRPKYSDVIRSLENPVWEQGALAILKGNLAPRGGVCRHTVVENRALLTKTYKARVFDTHRDVWDAIQKSVFQDGDVIIYRYQGPRGGPAMTECLPLINAMKAKGIRDIPVISDGRFSGWTKGYLAIGNVCPEAQIGGPLALVREGDKIRVDIPGRSLDLLVSEAEMARRKQKWTAPDQSGITGTLLQYAASALQADQGAGWPVRWKDLDRQ
ncbi:MAG: dihydroxy-acid dehydratase [Acidobacteriota bacterium]